MKAQVSIYRNIFGSAEAPLADFEVENLRVQMRDARGGTSCYIASRAIHEDGSYATDFEHDGASLFTMEFGVLSQTIVGENWLEVTGVLMEARSYDDTSFVPSLSSAGTLWEGAEKCDRCTGKQAHWVVERYVPPTASKIRVGDDKVLPVYGRYVVVRWGWS